MNTVDPFLELQDLIARHWGFRDLRPLQEPAMRAALEGRDSLVVLPTGGGKSLCFQAPALLHTDAPTVVISPLIALMKDQTDHLRAVGIPALHIDSTLTEQERRFTFQELNAGRVRLLFVAPERLAMESFRQFLQKLKVRTFVIDEAHCISHWGHDFRPDYRQLSALRGLFPEASFHAYTATATEPVRKDIISQLDLRDPLVLVGSFDRPNLAYRVLSRQKALDQVLEIIERHRNEAGIVYCIRRKDVDELAASLKREGVRALPYHAGMDRMRRRSTQEAFRTEKCDIVVATVAFGMGIDRSNVRYVIHTGMPKSIEHYQQEAGRAGRDGLEAECVLLFSGHDVITWKYIFEKGSEDAVDPEFLPIALRHLEEMSGYCRGAMCRHKNLVEHFGEPFPSTNCSACDVCLGEVQIVPDSQDTAKKILSCVARVQERFGVGHVVSVLRGENAARVRQYRHDALSTFGLLKGRRENEVRDWVYQLVNLGVLEQTEGEYPVLQLNDASWRVMRDQESVRLLQSEAKRQRTTLGETTSWEGVDRDLYEQLHLWRRRKAEDSNRPPYAVFNDATLRELARYRPRRLAELRMIYGIGDIKLAEFGKELLKEMHGADFEIPDLKDHSAGGPPPPIPMKNVKAAEPAFPLFRKGFTVADSARLLDRAISTTLEYLCTYIRVEKPASIDVWVDPQTQTEVKSMARLHGSQTLRPIFLALGEKVPYDSIKIVLAHLSSQTDVVDGRSE